MTLVKTTCEHHACDEEATHVVHWEKAGAPDPVFQCAAHAYRSPRRLNLPVETIAEYLTASAEGGKDGPT